MMDNTKNEKILLTGGAGYIASHTAVALIEAGHQIVIADNLANSSREAVRRVEKITGTSIPFYQLDVADAGALQDLFLQEQISAVIHFAGLKAVGESVEKPLEYYRNNLDTTLTLLETMAAHDVKNIVFSSSATVYGEENDPPYMEDMRKGACSNPYGWTKSFIEQILMDAAAADPQLSVVLLRYFNPIGAHPSGLIGEDPQGIPNNLMPFVSQVAIGRREKLTVFGGDYDTPDGTCRRDYIHVMDLAEGHVAAVDYAARYTGVEIFNLGTGRPYSVLEIVDAFEAASGQKVPYEIGDRRAGDLPENWADTAKAGEVLAWKARRGIEDMCRDSWNWQQKNPMGYR